MLLLRNFYSCIIFLAISNPISGQILWYYVSPYLSTQAVAVLRANGTSSNMGTVRFSQTTLYGPVTVQGAISGLAPGLPYRMLVHRFGDLTNGCLSIGSVFNPEQPTGFNTGSTPRTIGNLGNLQVGSNGIAQIAFTDSIITLHGRNNVIGRGLSIHQLTSSVPAGGNVLSNVGPVVACGVVGLAAEIP